VIDLADGPGFEGSCGTVAEAAFASAAVVYGSIFPEGADFIDDWNAQFSGHFDGWQRIEYRRVGMDDVRADFAGDFFEPGLESLHQGEFLENRQICERTFRQRCTIEAQAVDFLERCGVFALLGRGQVEGLPAQPPLFAQQCGGTEGVATVQRDGVVEDVKRADHACASGSMTLRRKASYINRVQIDAL